MGWDITTDGALVGDVEGVAVRAWEDRGRWSVLELLAPGVLPRMEMVQLERRVSQLGDGMREVHISDRYFEERYALRAADPWLARAVIDETVRRALLAAPEQSWEMRDDRLVARWRGRLEPLDLFARATALRVLMLALPWDAYSDRHTLPTHDAVNLVLTARRERPFERQPSMPRYA
jgi:hypothetical protein